MKKILFFILICTFTAISLSFTNSAPETRLTAKDDVYYKNLAKDIFRELIEINTSITNGSTKAAEAMAARLRSAGFPETDILVIGPDENHKNLVFRFRGKGLLKPVLFICHLDVVEALRQDWTMDPFTFIEKDNYFYGRGTTDIKNEDASLITNVIRLKDEGFKPDRDIIIALTADEEGGNANGVDWLANNKRDLIDADFCINPDGGGGDLKKGKPVTLAIQTSEKVYVSYRLQVRNAGGHSSLPVKDNAIYRLAYGLTRLSKYEFPLRLNETTRNYFLKVAQGESEQVKSDILVMLKTPQDTAAVRRLSASSAYYNAMMRTTCVATMLNAGHAENALPNSAEAIVNCRMVPDDNADNVKSVLKSVLADNQISVSQIYASFTAPVSPLRDDITIPVNNISTSMWPGVNVSPIMSTGASDGKYLRRLGIPVYGISGMFGDMDDVRAHGRDERIGVREFYDGVEFMYRLMKDLSSGK
jgi:acetylornithine deacetylase/succinyl-diaminopimelate desuccinylase-like protein